MFVFLGHIVQANLFQIITHLELLHVFHRQILQSWNEIKQQPNHPKNYIQDDIIWDNNYFQIDILIKRNIL